MKRKFLKQGVRCTVIITAFSMMFTSCKKDDAPPKKLPIVTTMEATNVTFNSAITGGKVTDTGNDEISAYGFAYSKSHEMPTIKDDAGAFPSGTAAEFTNEFRELSSGATYYVRAYATNSVGTGYGDVVSFTTGNYAPIATEVKITGDVKIGTVLTATYQYYDTELDPPGAATFVWYSADDATGTNEAPIAGATTSTYTPVATDGLKYIRVGVTPVATTGTATGLEKKSDFVGPVE